MRKIISIVLALCILLFPSGVSALTSAQWQTLYGSTEYYTGPGSGQTGNSGGGGGGSTGCTGVTSASGSCCVTTTSSPPSDLSSGGSTIVLNAAQTKNAQIIIGIAKSDNLPWTAGRIALMVALDESGLEVLSNPTVPVSLNYPGAVSTSTWSLDSVGVFQQRPSQGWSTLDSGTVADSDQATVWQLMDTNYAAEAFFGSPPGSTAPAALSKGLQDKPNWQTMNAWTAAQAVQASGTPDGSNYQAEENDANRIISQLWNTSPAVGLPIAITVASDNSSCTPPTTPSGSCNVTAPLYTEVLSVAQLTAIYGDPGTADSHPAMDANLTTINFDVGGNSQVFALQVNKLLAPCLLAVAQQIKSENINYTIVSMGCYRFDSDNGTSNIGLMSYHTYGAACDINPDTNPFSESGANVPHDMPLHYVQAFNAHGFYWGGDWTSPKDFMHFEFHGIEPPA